MILEIKPEHFSPHDLKKAVDVLQSGGLIAYPTDTVYGIGCDMLNKRAVEKIYDLKGRDKKRPLSFMCSDVAHISEYAIISNYQYSVMKKFFPGPYTFILEASDKVPKIVRANKRTVGIRIPQHKFCLEMVRELGHPIITTSANESSHKTFIDPKEIRDIWGHAVELIIDAGVSGEVPSTVVSLIGDVPEVIRRGKGNTRPFRAILGHA